MKIKIKKINDKINVDIDCMDDYILIGCYTNVWLHATDGKEVEIFFIEIKNCISIFFYCRKNNNINENKI